MKKILIIIYRYIIQFGLDPILLFKWFKNIFFYIQDYLKINKDKLFPISLNYPCLHDKYDNWWTAKWHYFHQDLLVAKEIFKKNPKKHVDIGSRIDWFVSHVAVFREIEVFDIRPIENLVENIVFQQSDLMKLDNKIIDYTDSISSLHAIEHFWLWRYWDPLDINWHIKGLDNIYQILKKWWNFYFSVPIWKQRIEFNAHRIFSIKYLVDYFQWKYDITEFSYVDDAGNLHKNVDIEKWLKNNFNCNFWCGIFILIKK